MLSAPADLSRPQAIVIAHYGKEILLETHDGERRRAITRQQLPALVSGDRVTYEVQANGHAVIEQCLPRRGVLTTQGKHGEPRILAANIDTVVIVLAIVPAIQLEILDRYLVACEFTSLQAHIVLNKIDLLDANTTAPPPALSEYEQLGYPVSRLSAKTGLGVEEFAAALTHKTAILVGQSGVGKSSLIQALLPQQTLRIGKLSGGHGRHTTSHSELYSLQQGGKLIDSPGVRQFTLPNIDPAYLAQTMVEFRAYLGQCRFADCSHRHEPDCAISAALVRQEISPGRYQRYCRIYQSLAEPQA